MSYNDGNSGNEGGGGNVWSSGSRGGSRGGYSRYNDDDEDGQRGGGSYRGSFGNNDNSRRGGGGGGSGGGYGFRRQNNSSGDVEILRDAVFIQNLPKDVTREQIFDVFSTVGTIKTDDRSGGPKIWIYKDRDTGEGNGRATVTYDEEDTANRAISEYNDQHVDSFGGSIRVQLAQRRPRNNDGYDRGGRGGYRGGRTNWDNNPRPGFNSGSGGRWGDASGGGGGGGGRGYGDNRRGGGGGGSGGGFRDRNSGGSDFYRDNDDRDGAYGGRGRPYRGASRGNGGSSNYAPY